VYCMKMIAPSSVRSAARMSGVTVPSGPISSQT